MVSGPVGAEDHVGIYVINVIGGTIRKLRDDAWRATVSPDGSRILFIASQSHDLMVMNADGQGAHTILARMKGDAIFQPTWSPDGRRIVYIKSHRMDKDSEVSLESRDANGGSPAVLVAGSDIRGLSWLPGDRILYAALEPSPHRNDMNLWEIDVDPKSGAATGKPRKLTDWPGFAFWHLSATSDGKRLAFVNEHDQGDVYVGELDKSGNEMKNPVRMTLSEKNDWLGGWLPDNITILFYSNRNGNFDLYRQKVAERSAETIGSAAEEKRTPQLSPDGKWFLYLSWPLMSNEAQPSSGHLMRLPVSGGAPEPVLEVKGYATWGPPGDVGRNVGQVPGFQCPATASAACVLVEGDSDKKHLTITPFDPVQGKKGTPSSIELPDEPAWSLSPDGSHIAFTWFDTQAATIRVVPVAGGASQDIPLKGLTEMVTLAWAADGHNFFVVRNSSKGSLILHATPTGESKVLFQAAWDVSQLAPSRDGHYLAYGAVNSDSNVWTIPNLPE